MNATELLRADDQALPRRGALPVADGRALRTYVWTDAHAETNARPVVVLAHGYGEYCGRYDELARYLLARGWAVCGFDMHGHGESPGQRGGIESYDQYVDDLSAFLKSTRERYPGRAQLLLGHSHGGLIALRFLQQNGHWPDGLILSSPMVALRRAHRPLPPWAACVLAKLAGELSLPNGLSANELTHDHRLARAWSVDVHNHGRTTPRWYAGALDAMEQARLALEQVTLPVLILQGDHDPVVDPDAVAQMTRDLGSRDRELFVCHGALHEPLNELDREQVYARIERWIALHFDNAST
ncbi:MAG: hypothetical protein RLZZ450_2358 [Pseudomonadota bacterium]|jgi:lysophospholipase